MEDLVGVVLALSVGLLGTLVGFERDRSFYPTIMAVIASYYALFAVMGGSLQALAVELIPIAAFLAVSVAGYKHSMSWRPPTSRRFSFDRELKPLLPDIQLEHSRLQLLGTGHSRRDKLRAPMAAVGRSRRFTDVRYRKIRTGRSTASTQVAGREPENLTH